MRFIFRLPIFLGVCFLSNSESALKLKEFRITAKDRMILYIDSSPVTLLYGRFWRQPDVIYLPESIQGSIYCSSQHIEHHPNSYIPRGCLSITQQRLCSYKNKKPSYFSLDLQKQNKTSDALMLLANLPSLTNFCINPCIKCSTIGVEVHARNSSFIKGGLIASSPDGFLNTDRRWLCRDIRKLKPVFTTLDLKPAKEIAPNAGKIQITEIDSNAKWIWAADDHAPSIYCHFNIEHFQGVIEYKGVILETSKEGGDGQYEATTYQGGPPESTSYQVLPELNAPPKNTEFRHTDIPKTDVKTDYLSVMTTVAKNGADESNRNNVLPDKSFQSFGKIDSSAAEVSQATINDENLFESTENAQRNRLKSSEASTISHFQVTNHEDKLNLNTGKEFENFDKLSDIASSISETSISDNHGANLREMWIAAVEDLAVYVNGESVSTFEFHSTFLPYRVRLPSVVSVLGVHAVSLDFNRVGIVSTSGDGQLDTNERWKCTNVNPGPNWEKEDFDDSDWPPAKTAIKNCAEGIKRDVKYLKLKKKFDASKTQNDIELDLLNGNSQANDSQETFNHQTQSNFKDTTESSIKTQNHFSINPMITTEISSDDLAQFPSEKLVTVNFQELHEDVVAGSDKTFPCIEALNREAWWISTENVLCTETCELFCRLKFSHFEMSVLPYETPPSKSQQSFCGCTR